MHTAAGTTNLAVAEVLATCRGVDVNAQNKDNKTPYDVASSNTMMQKCIADAGGGPSPNPSGGSSRDEPNARKRGGPASDARRLRAAQWRGDGGHW